MRSALGLWLVTLLCVFASCAGGEEVVKAERVPVHGKVVDADGEPVPGIEVRGTTYDDITEATSDAEGKFVLNVLEARRTQLQIVQLIPRESD